LKVSPIFKGPFEVLERIGELAYIIALPPKLSSVHDVFHVSILRKYESDPTHVLDFQVLEIDERITYVEEAVQILGRIEQALRNRTIPLVKILRRYHDSKEAT